MGAVGTGGAGLAENLRRPGGLGRERVHVRADHHPGSVADRAVRRRGHRRHAPGTRDHGERFVGFRMARTRRLSDPDRPLRLHAVLTEGALRLAVGDPQLRRAQLRHLLAMAELPAVTIQVVRPEDGPHTALTGQFVVLGFENVRSIGYVELHDGAVYLQDPDQVQTYTLVAENLQRVALGPEQSVALIQSMLTP
ncbi:MAG TPA: DUF5753 domain-containing protein [Pseudonocardiaceae bacterium]|nr:DUF5753 domain-containing protein [Pseudonocardiaceae bacterium]